MFGFVQSYGLQKSIEIQCKRFLKPKTCGASYDKTTKLVRIIKKEKKERERLSDFKKHS